MKFKIKQNQLKKILTSTAGIAPSSPPIAILENVYIKLDDEGIMRVVGTDSDIEIASSLALDKKDVTQSGETTVSAKKLLEICNSFSVNDDVSIEQKADKLAIVSGKSKFMLGTMSAEDFPKKDLDFDQSKNISLEIGRNELLRGIQSTSFAIAQNHAHSFFTGMLFDLKKDKIHLVATDGHRLATTSIPVAVQDNLQAIVPYKAIRELTKLLSQENVKDTLELRIGEHQVQFCLQDENGQICYLACNLIVGQYPDYEKAIPKDMPISLYVDKDVLSTAINRVSILANEKYRGIGVDISNKRILLTNKSIADAKQGDSAQEEIEINYTGDEVSMAFNAGYLIAALGSCNDDQVSINLSADMVAVIKDKENDSTFFVVMPIRY